MWQVEENNCMTQNACCASPRAAPKLAEVIGKALPFIGNYKSLDNKQQTVALIDDVGLTGLYF